MKRKASRMNSNIHRPKINQCLVWKAASNFSNYFRDEPLLDYLNKYRIYTPSHLLEHLGEISTKSPYRRKPSPSGMFAHLIEKGNKFESDIFEKLKTSEFKYFEFPNSVKEIFEDKNYTKTCNLLSEGEVDIIFHGIVRNYLNNTFGAPDLIMKGRVLKTLFEKSPEVNDDFYYIVDVKSSTLQLDVSGKYLQNSLLYDGYRAQLAVYSQALRDMIRNTESKAFVLGKGASHGGVKVKNPFYSLGFLDFQERDLWVYERIEDAIEWFNRLEKEGDDWTLLPPSIPELCPNMNNTMDGNMCDIKKILANRNGEITQIWNCGVDNRRNAFSNSVYSLNDLKLTPEILGIVPTTKKYSIIKKMLDMRKSQLSYLIPLENNVQNWREPLREGFLDFETLLTDDDETFIFMIGVMYEKKYYSFTAESGNLDGEGKIWKDFNNWLKTTDIQKLYHWGNAECSISRRMTERHQIPIERELVDMLDIFKDSVNPIIIKNCYNFGLKTIVNTLYNLGIFSEKYGVGVQDGGDAMVIALHAYTNNTLELLEDIKDYNHKDCRVVGMILNFIRNC